MEDFEEKLDELVDEIIEESEERAIAVAEIIGILEAKVAALKAQAGA